MKLSGKSLLGLVLTAFLVEIILYTFVKTQAAHQGGLTVETSEETSENGHLANAILELKDEHEEHLSKEISKQPPETSGSEA